jgi:hypothetical protein
MMLNLSQIALPVAAVDRAEAFYRTATPWR